MYYCEKVIMIRVKWKAGAYTAAIAVAGSDAGLLLACTFATLHCQLWALELSIYWFQLQIVATIASCSVWRSSTDWRAVLVKALVHKSYVPMLTTAACIACMFQQQEHLMLDCQVATTAMYYCEKVIMIRVKWKAGTYTAAIAVAGSDAKPSLVSTFCNTSLHTLALKLSIYWFQLQ